MGSSASDESAANERVVKNRWKPEEDAKLIKLVAERGAKEWATISEYIPGRSGKSCRLRWFNQLSPCVDSRPFTLDEDEIIMKAHAELGTRWALISRMLVGRTDNAVKNHWNSTLRRRLRRAGRSSYESEPDQPNPRRADLARSGLNGVISPSPLVETRPIPYSGRASFNKFSYPGPALFPADQEDEPQTGLSLFLGSELGESSTHQAPPPMPEIHLENANGKRPVEMVGIDPYLLRMMESSTTTPLPQSPTPPPPPPPPQEIQWMMGGENMLEEVTVKEVKSYMDQQHSNGGMGGCGGRECYCSIDCIANAVISRIRSNNGMS